MNNKNKMKNRNYGWQYLTLQNKNIFVKDDFNQSLDLFWTKVMNNLDNGRVVGVLLKVRFSDNSLKSFSSLQKLSKSDLELARKVFNFFINTKGNNYQDELVSDIIFQYIILNKGAKAEIVEPIKNEINYYKINGYNLPLTTDLTKWGEITEQKGNKIILGYGSKYSDVSIEVRTSSIKQSYKFMIEDKKVLELVDTLGNNPTSFTRIIEKTKKFIVENGIIVFESHQRNVESISTIDPCKELTNKFLTLDLETRTIDGILSPYCVGIFDGDKKSSFYLSDFKTPDVMMKAAIGYLIKAKYSGWNIYIHNGSSFDLIFLLRIITQLNIKIEPLIKDGKFINIKLSWGRYIDKKTNKVKFRYHINFRDSFLILPSSLRKLAKSFAVENKGHFPYLFVNDPSISLQYEGLTPDFKLFEGLDKKEYDSLLSEKWSLRNETIKYCLLDCVVLYQIIDKFNNLIFTKWHLNVHRFPTLSSLAFGIFRAHYLGDHYIPKLGGSIYDFIKQSYTGGRVDVFKPQGNDLYYYDVNSLYPTVYSSQAMPVGKPEYFKGNILDYIPDAFGFFRCNITAPSNLNIPILQTHVETSAGKRTVAPLGSWSDVLFSEEMHLAINYGYKIEVLEGYTFDKTVVFDKYAEDLFAIKSSHSPSDPMYLISKLLLNSLYGRFGMSLDLEEHEIIDNRKLARYIGLTKEHMPEIIDLNNGKSIISKITNKGYERDCDTASMNVSIGIASAITAYARIHMSTYLQNPNYNVYYSDTDSIVTDKPIDSKHIGKELGQMKLEYKISKAVFLAPKVYGIITDSGKVVTKVKGFKDSLSFELLESLLVKDSALSLNQNKWFRDLSVGQIEIKNQLYSLRATENKRQLIYDKRGLAIDTKPFYINENKEVMK
jgi:hypothetical protein